MTNSFLKKERMLYYANALLVLLFLFFNEQGYAQTTTTYTQQITNYYDTWTTGTAGSFNQGLYQVGMFANGAGTKQVVRWRKFRTDVSGANTSDRTLQVGDQFVVTLSATRANGRIGFALLASPSTGSWANRESNYAISINLDGPAYNSGAWGNWYLRANGGATLASSFGGLQGSYKNFTFTLTLTAPNRMNVVMTDGIATSTFNDVQLNTSNPITDYSIYMDDDWDGGANRNIFWGLALVSDQHTVTNTGALNIGASNNSYTISGIIPNGLVSNSASTSFTNTLTKTGTGTITLGAANTLGGSININNGILRLNTTNAIASSNSIFIDGSAGLTFGSGISGNVALGFTQCISNSGTPPSINFESSASAVNVSFSSFAMSGSSRLTITGWTPTGNKRIYIVGGGMPLMELNRIDFDGYGLGAKIDPVTNELLPKFFYLTQASGVFNDGGPNAAWVNNDKPSFSDGTATILVQTGHVLTLNETFNFLKVEVAGTLVMNNANSITTNASASGGISNIGTITMVNGSTINIGNNGTFSNAGTISMVAGSIINMAGGTTWSGNGIIGSSGTINFTGTGTIASTSTLPVVTISGNVDFNASTIGTSLEIRGGGAVTPNAPFYAIGSTLIYNVSGTYNRTTEWGSNSGQGYPYHVQVNNGTTVNLNVNPISASAFGIGGDLTIQTGATLNTGALNTTSFTVGGNTDVSGTFNASGMTTAVYDLYFTGNLRINGMLTLSTVNGCDLYLSGDWIRTGTFTANSRAVYLRGGSSSITATGGETFPFLRIEKTAAANTVTLNNTVTITSEVSFTTGVVISTAANLFTMADGSALNTINPGSFSSFVAGPMRKIGTGAFTFPVGKVVSGVNHFRTIGIGNVTTNTDAYTAEFFRRSSYHMGGLSSVALANGLQRVSHCEYWSLVRSGSTNNVSVTLSWAAISNCNAGAYVNDLSELVIVQYNGTQWGDTFGGAGTSAGPTVPAANNLSTVTWTGPTAYQYFSLGSTDADFNPLPFNLLKFEGRSRNNDIELNFTAGGNDEQKQYMIERSIDGRNFSPISTIAAKANINTADYSTVDEQPINGWNYYRLTAIDMIGQRRQSQIIRIWFGSRTGKPAIYPNPVQGNTIQLFTGGMSKGNYNLQLLSMDGKLIYSSRWVFDGVQPLHTIRLNELAKGMYSLIITGDNQSPVQLKLVK
jgi:autotransporter-associated beta strand protein